MKRDKHKLQHSKNATITNESGATEIDIHINGISHISFIKKKYIGRLAWYESKNDFKLEIYCKGKTILTEYNSIEKWKQVINIIKEEV